MKSTSTFAALLLCLIPSMSHAASYSVAICAFLARPDHSGWDEMLSAGPQSGVELGVGEKMGLWTQDTRVDAICGMATGTADSSSIAVSWSAASGSNVQVQRGCVFTGDGITSATTQNVIKQGESAFIDHRFSNGDLIRTAAYLATPQEAAAGDWFETACQALAKRMGPSLQAN